ncbi:hypothetical protein [Vibrio zhugei]|nr:hypothetical protein [Vibrio zhugei]
MVYLIVMSVFIALWWAIKPDFLTIGGEKPALRWLGITKSHPVQSWH